VVGGEGREFAFSAGVQQRICRAQPEGDPLEDAAPPRALHAALQLHAALHAAATTTTTTLPAAATAVRGALAAISAVRHAAILPSLPPRAIARSAVPAAAAAVPAGRTVTVAGFLQGRCGTVSESEALAVAMPPSPHGPRASESNVDKKVLLRWPIDARGGEDAERSESLPCCLPPQPSLGWGQTAACASLTVCAGTLRAACAVRDSPPPPGPPARRMAS
jgi:hypothetical protein